MFVEKLYDYVACVHQPEDRNHWQPLANTEMKRFVPQQFENFLSRSATTGLTIRTVFLGIS
jgi:hypothetical protein